MVISVSLCLWCHEEHAASQHWACQYHLTILAEKIGSLPRTVYIASFFDTRERLYPIRESLRSLGITVTSNWLDEPTTDFTDSTASWVLTATRDVNDIRASNLVFVDTLDETPRGGREVELGYALALGKRVVLVGPRRNVFHWLVDRADSWSEVLKALALLKRAKGT